MVGAAFVTPSNSSEEEPSGWIHLLEGGGSLSESEWQLFSERQQVGIECCVVAQTNDGIVAVVETRD